MIKSSFQHLKGFGKKTERDLWRKGITNWDIYLKSLNPLLEYCGASHIPNALKSSYDAYEKLDMDYFGETMPRSEYYRIALEAPRDVMFVDIETTGLSVYYDIITIVGWSLGKKFGVYINGQDDTEFRQALCEAKTIVTFNGTLFDLKFINKHFDSPKAPKTHLDLRFFAKRVGLSGGQKKIEKELGFQRNSDIEKMLGEAAPILWHKYRRGDNDAMKRLIEYNHADVEGMKFILDECIKRIFVRNKIPKKIQRKTKFTNLCSTIKWAQRSPSKSSAYKIFIPEYSGSTQPLITYKDLNAISSIDDYCVIGIDLVSSEDRETGFCVLKGNNASTCRVKTDDDMIQMALDAGANLISIDSPLSIPKGRTTFFDDDPYREEFGITRQCERILKRRGINSYPCLIQSMQKLTRRGMLLAEKFRKLGIPVIESYPGAAQDIMSIPRKQAGLDYLVDGLVEFGISGDFQHTQVSHDELDAITSAIVGHFFWVGMFEGLGNPDEKYLIIPDLNANYSKWLSRSVIGISGISTNGFNKPPFKLFKVNDDNEQPVTFNKPRLKQIIDKLRQTSCAIITGLQFQEELALLTENFGPAFTHLHCSTPSAGSNQAEPLAILANSVISNQEAIQSVEYEIDRILSNKDTACQ